MKEIFDDADEKHYLTTTEMHTLIEKLKIIRSTAAGLMDNIEYGFLKEEINDCIALVKSRLN